MISSQDRQKALELINKAIAQGVRTVKTCEYLGIAFSTYLKWGGEDIFILPLSGAVRFCTFSNGRYEDTIKSLTVTELDKRIAVLQKKPKNK